MTKNCNLITDFGHSHYVGAMKGVLHTRSPGVNIIDTDHNILPQSIEQASFVLNEVFDYFPENTVHLVVVDPGVGSRRPILAAEIAGQFIVCPNNGILSHLLRRYEIKRCVEVQYNDKDVSQTFHGRDVMAPAVTQILNDSFSFEGETLDPVLLPHHPPVVTGASIRGVVEFVDHFGNMITNIERNLITQSLSYVDIKGKSFPFFQTYADSSPGEKLSLIGSSGKLELAINQGSAAKAIKMTVGASVEAFFSRF